MRNTKVSLLIMVSLLFFQGQSGCQENTNLANSSEYVFGEIIVKFESEAFNEEDELIAESVRLLNEKNGLVSMERLFKVKPTKALADIYVLRFPKELNIIELVEEYAKDLFVIYAEPNYTMHTQGQN
ncbi:hypothetical protein ACFL2G_02610 [Candidatus Omnitrophota bacterium]